MTREEYVVTLSVHSPTPASIVDIATGYMGAKQLFTASRVGLFAALDQGPLSVTEIADRTGVSTQLTRILADSMTALGLLRRAEGSYELTAEASTYLTGKAAEFDLAPFLAFLNEISYRQWLEFDHVVDTSKPGSLDLDEAGWGAFMTGVMSYNRLHAQMMAERIDFGGYAELLDLGGLSGAFSIEAMKANDDLTSTLVYDPQMVDPVLHQVAEAGFADRTTVVGAPTPDAEPDGAFDLVMVNHVVHRFDEPQNRGILQHARAAAVPGARLLLLDFFLDDDPEQRRLDAFHAAEYMVIDGTVVYRESEVRTWLSETGWRPVEKVALPGSPRVLLAEAT